MSDIATKIENPFATHGAVSWTELATSDPEAAKAFYGAVFGWEFEEMEMSAECGGVESGPGTYTCIVADGVKIGGLMQTPCPERTTVWSNYVTVSDIAKAKAAAEAGGANLMGDVRQVPGVGKMFGFKDRQGAIINAIEYEAGHQ